MNWTILTAFLGCLSLASGDRGERTGRNLSFSNILSNYFNKYPAFRKNQNVPVPGQENPGKRRKFPYEFVPPPSVSQKTRKSDTNINVVEKDEAGSKFTFNRGSNINNLRSSNIIVSDNLIKLSNDLSNNIVYGKESSSNMVESQQVQVTPPHHLLVVARQENRKDHGVGGGGQLSTYVGNDNKVRIFST